MRCSNNNQFASPTASSLGLRHVGRSSVIKANTGGKGTLMSLCRSAVFAIVILGAVALSSPASAQSVNPALFDAMRWRLIGPFRGGRISAVSGVIGQPGTFYAGLPMGGVWKTTDAGWTWHPIFDSVRKVCSIGSVAVAPSDPNVIYVGTGDMVIRDISRGDGIWKSTDAGKTWFHSGLSNAGHIPSLLVDPKNPDIVLAACQGDLQKDSNHRGIYRSEDGGKSWTKVLFVDDVTGGVKLAWDPNHPDTILATTNQVYFGKGARPFFRRGAKPPASHTFVYKSTDEGKTWTKLSGGGLPPLFGRTCVAIAMHTHDQRMFLVQNSGLWRSDDGGSHWKQMDASDPRVRNGQGGYNCGVYVNTGDPNTVYVINTSSYISRDGGNTFTGWKGAPGGDDPQQMWLDPTDSNRILLGMDQGAAITYNDGQSWSLWYNQPTGQFYHIGVDNRWPFWVYGTEQDSASIATSERGIYGEITPLDWSPNPAFEFGTVVPDPINPNISYGMGSNGGIEKCIFPSGQWVTVGPDADPNLHLRTSFSRPLVFSQTNPHELLAGFQMLMATTDGGMHWRAISPDLTHPKGWKPPKPEVKPPVKKHPKQADDFFEQNSTTVSDDPDAYHAQFGFGGGAIECISTSSVKGGVIWVGTSNGLIKVTQDGGATWHDASIPKIPGGPRADISSIDASHQDPAEAYASVDSHGSGDDGPHLYRTTDFGKTWTEIINGLAVNEAGGSFCRVIRADTVRKGLLYAGTESDVYVSFDDGDHWQSLDLNLPNTSYRDLVVHGDDLVAGTFGRAIWVLDDLSPLRQASEGLESKSSFLYKPANAIRVQRNVGQDTPFPPEVPHAKNPPEGAIFDYLLKAKPLAPITLTIKDSSGQVVRVLSSSPRRQITQKPPNPDFWLQKRLPLSTHLGDNRVVWDLRWAMPPAFEYSWNINANPHETPPSPRGPMVLPGKYTAILDVDGNQTTQTFTITNDPNSPGNLGTLKQAYGWEMKVYSASESANAAYNAANALKAKIADLLKARNLPADVVKAANALSKKVDSAAGSGGGGGMYFFFMRRNGPPTLSGQVPAMNNLLDKLDSADTAPAEPVVNACKEGLANYAKAMASWSEIKDKDLPALNNLLKKNNIPVLSV